MGSQVVGENRSQLPGKETVREVRREVRCGRRSNDKTKERVNRFRIRFTREREKSKSLALVMIDEACQEAEM